MQTCVDISVGEEKLAACLHMPKTSRPGKLVPVVVCCHGLTGTRVGTCYRFVTLARELARQDIACLRFDFRGCGESDGLFSELTPLRLVEDLRAVVAAVDRLPGCDPMRIGIAASSFGALTASLSAHELDSLRCMVFWAPVADAQGLVDHDMTDGALAFLREHGWVEHLGMRLGRAFIEGIPKLDAAQLLSKAARPLLIFHGQGDEQVPIEQGRAYERALASSGVEVRMEALPVSDHGMRSVAANDRIIEESVAWFRRFLHAASLPPTTV